MYELAIEKLDPSVKKAIAEAGNLTPLSALPGATWNK